MAAEKKHAAYICKGCELGTRLDAAALVKVATKEGKMQLVREHDFLCSAEGVALIKNDIDNEGVTHVAIAACSRRAKTEAFNFPTVALSRGNLREGVIWIRPRQEMAADYVRMGCAEVKAMKQPAGNAKESSQAHPRRRRRHVRHDRRAGKAEAGYKVVLVEKTGALGGMAAKLWKRQPFKRRPTRRRRTVGVAETGGEDRRQPN
jgi:quinone-modifying oxidoreductase subunit QmoB